MIDYLKCQCNQWGPWIGINGQLAVCISKVILLKQYIVTGLPVQPSYKFGFFVEKWPPGGGKTQGSGTEKLCSHKWFHTIFPCTDPCTNTFCTSSPPPQKPRRRCEPEEGYLRCSKRFDHRSHSIIFLLFEFKSVDDIGAGKLREMLTLHTNPHAVHGRFTLKDDCERQVWNAVAASWTQRENYRSM